MWEFLNTLLKRDNNEHQKVIPMEILKDSLPGREGTMGLNPNQAVAQFKQVQLEIWYKFSGESN